MTIVDTEQLPFSDLSLARRLERAEGRSNAEFVEARARRFPDSGAQWIEVAGADAMYDGVDSPCTQTFGLGLFEPTTAAALETIEAFYRERGAPVSHEVSPLAGISLLALLNERGYQPIELTSVTYRPVHRGLSLSAPLNEQIQVRIVGPDEQELWARTAAEGWSEFSGLSDSILEMGSVTAERPDARCFLAELAGRSIAAGALTICDGVALLAGASTVPQARRQGAQLALLESRLRYAAEQGCDLAMMGALPGSASQRNAERHGFRIAYTRTKWQLARA